MEAEQKASEVGQKAVELGALTLAAGWIVIVFIGVAGAIILWYMISEKIDLTNLISEKDGTASLSRFQFLVFTFVIALSLFLVIVGPTPPDFPKKIPPEILALLGISGGSYVISKGIQKNAESKDKKGTGGAGAPAPVTDAAGGGQGQGQNQTAQGQGAV